MMEKKCLSCGQVKSVDEFHVMRRGVLSAFRSDPSWQSFPSFQNESDYMVRH